MKLYTVELTTPKLEHVVTIDVEAESFGGAEREARKLYDWAKPVTVKAVRLNEDPTANYDNKLQYIPLTGEAVYCEDDLRGTLHRPGGQVQ